MANLFSYSTLDFLAWVAAVLRAKGVYITRTVAKQDESGATKATADVAVDHIQAYEAGLEAPFQPTEDDRFFAEMAHEAGLNSSPDTEYGQVCRKYAQLESIDVFNRQVTGVLASVVGMFRRQHETEKLNADLKSKGMKINEYYGEIRKRETFVDLVVLTDSESRSGHYGNYWTAKLATPGGHWLTTYDAHPGWKANEKVSVKATVKKHFEDKGGNRWTVLGNVTVLTPEDVNNEIAKADRKSKREAKKLEPKTPEQIERSLKAKATRERQKAEKEAAKAALEAEQTAAMGTCEHCTGYNSYYPNTHEQKWERHQQHAAVPVPADMNEVSHG